MKTAGGCSGGQAPCDCGGCHKCLHAQSKNPRAGDVLDEQVIFAAKAAIDKCPAVSHLEAKILHVVAQLSPVLTSVYSKRNVQRSFEISGVWPLDPLRVLEQWKGFESTSDQQRDCLADSVVLGESSPTLHSRQIAH